MTKSPLALLYREMGASMGPFYGWELPLSFSGANQEYQCAQQSVALADRSYVGRIEASGKDALDLIHRLSTNDLLALPLGSGKATVLISSKGRILDLLHVVNLGDRLIILTGPQNQEKVVQHINFYTFAEELSLKDITMESSMLCLIGPKAYPLLQAFGAKGGDEPGLYSAERLSIDGVSVLVIRTDPVGLSGYDLIIPVQESQRVARAIIERGKPWGLAPIGEEALEILRVEAGVPQYGKELSEEYNPLEADLLPSISYTKGCYVGQEVIARLATYKKVQRHLVGIAFEGDVLPTEGSALKSLEREIGRVTSVVHSPRLGKPLALGYIRLSELKPGIELQVHHDGKLSVGQVVDLPIRPT